jgi:hypothetical protein
MTIVGEQGFHIKNTRTSLTTIYDKFGWKTSFDCNLTALVKAFPLKAFVRNDLDVDLLSGKINVTATCMDYVSEKLAKRPW